jgi:hypothetical protein
LLRTNAGFHADQHVTYWPECEMWECPACEPLLGNKQT